MSETSLQDENVEKASKPVKNGKSMKRKVDTKNFLSINRKKNVREGELKISRDTILITLGSTTIYNNFINFFFFFF